MFDNEQIVAGIGPGGLFDIYEIKILICYLFYSVKKPLTKNQLDEVIHDSGAVNYFSYTEALTQLLESGHIITERQEEGQDEQYILKGLGIETAEKLANSLPRSLKNRVVDTALALISQLKRESEHEIKIEKAEDGYFVHLAIHDIGSDLMDLKLFAPDETQAENIKEKLRQNTVTVYKTIISILLEDKTTLQDILQKL